MDALISFDIFFDYAIICQLNIFLDPQQQIEMIWFVLQNFG